MRISVEWFLLDNLIMNFCVLKLGSAFSGLPLRRRSTLFFAAIGSVYALVSMLYLPWLLSPIAKIVFTGFMAFPMMHHMSDVPRAVGYLLISACLMGGIMLCLCVLFGGSFHQGILIGTMQIRIAIVGFAICSALPRVFRIIRSQVYSDMLYVPLQIRYRDMTVFLTALVDSGNLLKEPITQKPIIVMKSGIWGQPIQSGYPVAYQSVGGNGILFAVSAQSVQVFQQRWHAIDAMITESDSLSQSVDAILPMCLLPKERKGNDALQTENVDHEAIHPDPILSKKTVALYSFRRNFAGALSGRRGTGVDQSIDDRGSGSKECVD